MRIRQMDDSQRGNGFTTAQMRRAPQGALYIWPVHSSIGYARDLARELGRDDLVIFPPSVLEHRGELLRGCIFSGLVLDHACEPDADEYEVLRDLRAMLVK